MSEQNLQLIQSWMQSVITTRGSLEEKFTAAGQLFSLDKNEVIRSTARLSADKRMEIYTSGYVLRLLDCLKADLPLLLKFLGEEVFHTFAKAYLLHQPSSSWSVFDLSAGFAAFLDRTGPQQNDLPEEQKAWYALPAALVRLERAKLEAMRAPGTEGHLVNELSFPILFSGNAVIRIPECVRLLNLELPLADFILQLEKDERPSPPALCRTYVIAGRKDYRVSTEQYSSWQYYFLKALQEKRSLAESISASAEKAGMEEATLLADLYLWLPVAFEKGWIMAH